MTTVATMENAVEATGAEPGGVVRPTVAKMEDAAKDASAPLLSEIPGNKMPVNLAKATATAAIVAVPITRKCVQP